MAPFEVREQLKSRLNQIVDNSQIEESKRYIIVQPRKRTLQKKDNDVDRRAKSTQHNLLKAALGDFKKKMVTQGFTKTEVRDHLER